MNLVRIAMWSGPRNISTAMMRSFENRADTTVIDEPFYACFLSSTDLTHPMRDDILRTMNPDWSAVANDLTDGPRDAAAVFYQKHMCHHMLPGVDLGFADRLTNAFLIRDPDAMVASYAKAMDRVSPEALGLDRQLEIFTRQADRLGMAPPVVDSADILKDPEGMLRALSAALGIAFDPAMLAWPRGPRPSDGVWAPHWYESVEASTGFAPPRDHQTILPDPLRKVADAIRPAYEKMKHHRITA